MNDWFSGTARMINGEPWYRIGRIAKNLKTGLVKSVEELIKSSEEK